MTVNKCVFACMFSHLGIILLGPYVNSKYLDINNSNNSTNSQLIFYS